MTQLHGPSHGRDVQNQAARGQAPAEARPALVVLEGKAVPAVLPQPVLLAGPWAKASLLPLGSQASPCSRELIWHLHCRTHNLQCMQRDRGTVRGGGLRHSLARVTMGSHMAGAWIRRACCPLRDSPALGGSQGQHRVCSRTLGSGTQDSCPLESRQWPRQDGKSCGDRRSGRRKCPRLSSALCPHGAAGGVRRWCVPRNAFLRLLLASGPLSCHMPSPRLLGFFIRHPCPSERPMVMDVPRDRVLGQAARHCPTTPSFFLQVGFIEKP